MRLPDQIRAVACVSWVGVLGFATYFACEADLSSRSGVIREGSAGGTRLADLGAHEAQSRPRTGEAHTGHKGLAKSLTPGFASESPEGVVESCPSLPACGLLEPVAHSQGVRSVLSPLSGTRVLLKEAGRGSFSVANSVPKRTVHSVNLKHGSDNTDAAFSRTDRGPSLGEDVLGFKDNDYSRKGGSNLEDWAAYVVTAYSAGCILPKFGPEPPPQPMASGEWPVAGLHVAADPSLAFGTVLEVVYRGLPSRLIVGDRGRAIKGRRLDLFLATCRAARAWGRRTAYVREIGASE